MFSLINFKSLLKRRESVVMKPNIDLGDVIPCRTTIATGITCVVGVIGSAVLLIQGVKYFSQISNRRERKEENRQRNKQSNVCSQCGIKVNLEDITTFAVCRSCDETICRSRHCSDWDRQTGYWECLVCIKSRDSQVRAGEWILDQLNRRFKVPRSEQSREDVVSYKDAETQSERSFNGSTYSISLEQKERVRQFLEEVIAEVVGGSLDEIPVTQLNRHPEYLPVWDHECPGVTHLNLKRLIQKVMAEAMRLPDLFNQSGIPPRPEEHMPFFDPKKYEQLVATAVLNKIIETFRNPKNSYADLSSGIHTGSEAENVNEKRVSSMSDQGEPKEDPQYLKEYIQKHKVPLPDLSTAGDSEGTLDDISDCQSVRSSGTEGTWEENWLFKKRKLKAEATASIAMLVPSPTEEVKALIGDKNADEISDLSEAEDVDNDSDNDEDVKELPSVLVQSKTVIGGKNELNSFDDDSSIGDNSLVSNPDSGINVTETKNDALMADEDFVKVDKPIEEAVNVNVKVVEAIVAEAKIVQEEKPVAAPRKASRDEPAAEDVKKPAGDTVPVLEENIPEEKPEGGNVDENNNSPDEHLIPGSLAEREHLKWLKATAEIPNNPYSAEALQKRIKGSTDPTAFTIPTTTNVEQTHDDEINREEALQKEDEKEKTNDYSSAQERSIQVVLGSGEPDYKRYGRDYYINDSKRARGTRKKAESDEVNRQVSSEDVSDSIFGSPQPSPTMIDKNYCNDGVKSTSGVNINSLNNINSNNSNSYIMNKFLMETGVDDLTPASVERSPAIIHRSTSLKSFRANGLSTVMRQAVPRREDTEDSNSVLSLDRKTYEQKKKLAKQSHYTSEFSIPAKILYQFEAKSLYTDLRRDSLRARSGTQNFALNPIFDGLPITEPGRKEEAKVLSVHNSLTDTNDSNPASSSSISDTDSTMSWQYLQNTTENDCKNNCIETSFTPLVLPTPRKARAPIKIKEFSDNLY